MPDAIITSTASTFGTISGTFAADQSTITGTVTGGITGTISGSVGIPGPVGPAGPGSTWGGIAGVLSNQVDLWSELGSKYPASNPSGFITASALSPYLTTATANATFQTLAGMSSYLTTSAAAAGYYPLTGNPSGFLTAASLSGYATESWVTGQGYITSSALSPYLSKADNLASVASVSTARDNLGLGSLSNPTFAGVTVQGSGANVANLTPTSLSLTHATSGSFTIQPSVGITFPNGSVQTTAYPGPVGATTWGSIVGTLSNQTDLQTALNGKAPSAAGMPISGTVGQVLTKNSGTSYDASWQSFVPGDRYVTTSTSTLSVSNGTKSLTIGTGLAYTPNQDVTISLTSDPTLHHMHGPVTSYNSGTGALVVDVQNHTGSGTFSSWTVNVGGTVPLETVEWGEVLGTLGDQTDLATALNAKLEITDAASTYYLQTNPAGFITSAALTPYLTSATAAATYRALSNNTFGSIGITAGNAIIIDDGGLFTDETVLQNKGLLIRDGSTLVPIARFQSDIVLLPSSGLTFADTTTQTSAGITAATAAATYYPLTGNPSGFLTSSALTPYAPLAGATFTGEIILPASTTATASLTIPHGSAPTTPVNGEVWTTTSGLFVRINGTTRQYVDFDGTQTINGSKTFSNANQTLGNSTAAGTINIGTGATISGATKAINLGTSGVAGSTTNITIGSTTGTSTTTLQGNTNGVTQSAGNSTTLLATTAFVTTADNLKANLASPTFTGVPLSTTASADTNTTQIATTAYVVGQAASATPAALGTAAVGTSLRYARQDHVHANPLPTGGTTAQVLSKVDGTNYNVQWTTVATGGGTWGSITGTLSSQTDLQSALDAKLDSTTAASTYQTISGMSSYLTTAAAAAGYYPLTGNPSGFLTSAPVTSVAGKTGAVTLVNTDISGLGTMATATAADYSTTTVANGLYYPLTGNPSGFLTSAPVSSVAGRTGAVTLSNTDISGLGTMATAAAADYALLAGATFTGKVNTPASTTTTAGLNLPHGTTPTTPVNGDIWTTTGNILWRRNGGTQTIPNQGTSNTFSAGAKQTVSHSATTAGLNVGPVAGDPSSLANGDVWYNSTTNAVNARVNGGTHQLNTVKAWVNFNGTGTVAIRASFNVTSITDNGVGDYTVNFTTALADANYSVQLNRNASAGNGWTSVNPNNNQASTASLFRIGTANVANTVAVDVAEIYAAVFR